MKRNVFWVALCVIVLGVGAVSVAQVSETFDDPKVPATVDPVLRDAAVDAILATDFGSATTPTLPPPIGQLMSGSTQDLAEIAPHVWFGLSGPGEPAEKGFYLVRQTAPGVFVSVPTPAPFSVAASNGTEVFALSNGGVYGAPVAGIQAGIPVWSLRSTPGTGPWDGFNSGYAGPEGSIEKGGSSLICYRLSCLGFHWGGFVDSGGFGDWVDGPGRVNFLTFDGFVTSTRDRDTEQQTGPMSVGDGVLQQAIDTLTRSVYSTDVLYDEYSLRRVRPLGEEVRFGHWSNTRNKFVGVVGSTIMAWLPDTGVQTLLATEPQPLLDALELPDSTLLSVRCVGNDVVVKRGTQKTNLGPLPCDEIVGFGQYHSGDFLTIESGAGAQGTTLWSSYDTARTWTPAPPNGTPIVTPSPVQAAHASNRFTLSGSGH